MKRRFALFAVAVSTATLLAAGCSFGAFAGLTGLRGSGRKGTESRAVGSFTKIELRGSVDAEVKVGASGPLVVEGDDNLLSNVTAEVRGDTLVVSTKEQYTTSRVGLKVRVSTPRLEGLSIEGSADAVVEDLKGERFKASIAGSGDMSIHGGADVFEIAIAGSGDVNASDVTARKVSVHIDGSGDVRLVGSAEELAFRTNGSGDINAGDFKVKRAKVELNGSGDATINASEAVEAALNGSGDIFLFGQPPQVKTSGHGSGDIVRK
ncbi:MAG: head GIN domain-containing protein [Candidatus Polarisedimenticolia bacterium]|nr:DUF2807 domain-containing protein [bacterium]